MATHPNTDDPSPNRPNTPPPPTTDDTPPPPTTTPPPPSTDAPLTISTLNLHPLLTYKLHLLIHDLRSFATSPASRHRLDSVLDPSYIGAPYFTPAEADSLKNLLIPAKTQPDSSGDGDGDGDKTLATLIESTLHLKLSRRMKKRIDSGDFRVCAAHDVAPILEQAFGIRMKDLSRDKAFLRTVRLKGLDVEGEFEWAGIGGKAGGEKGGGRKGGGGDDAVRLVLRCREGGWRRR